MPPNILHRREEAGARQESHWWEGASGALLTDIRGWSKNIQAGVCSWKSKITVTGPGAMGVVLAVSYEGDLGHLHGFSESQFLHSRQKRQHLPL